MHFQSHRGPYVIKDALQDYIKLIYCGKYVKQLWRMQCYECRYFICLFIIAFQEDINQIFIYCLWVVYLFTYLM
jgi:hypothetical protein